MAQLEAVASNYHQVQSRTSNNNNDISTSFDNSRNNDVVVSATVTSTETDNAFLKRSRSSEFVRGESSNQSSQVGGAFRRHTNPPPPSFQHETVNNNSNNSGFSSMLEQQVNRHGISATQNSITNDSHMINRRHAHASQINFFADTPSYNSPYESIIDDNVACLIFPSRQEIPRESFTMTRITEPISASTSTTSLYPSAMTGGETQVAVSTSPFQRNNNFLSSEAVSSLSSRSPRWEFNSFNNTNNNNNNINTNLDIFDPIEQRFNDTFNHSTINVQQYVRLLPGGHVDRFLAPSIVHVRSNNFVPQGSQPPYDPSTSSYLLNPPSAPTAVESDQYMQPGTILAGQGNRRRGNNRIFTSTSPELRAWRNRLRDEVFLFYFFNYLLIIF
ncbi:uncharacterized protein LOC131650133 [Vicia villosa]|uniref:uncharacterized protein LOC131650133 n=1 Tax=Vicia villosa TaxID=3911 RepID=UPI00273C4C8D|nr:uncharacterized protein LOC131650133 [Vicia villosa]